jgi:hypothetical protein
MDVLPNLWTSFSRLDGRDPAKSRIQLPIFRAIYVFRRKLVPAIGCVAIGCVSKIAQSTLKRRVGAQFVCASPVACAWFASTNSSLSIRGISHRNMAFFCAPRTRAAIDRIDANHRSDSSRKDVCSYQEEGILQPSGHSPKPSRPAIPLAQRATSATATPPVRSAAASPSWRRSP